MEIEPQICKEMSKENLTTPWLQKNRCMWKISLNHKPSRFTLPRYRSDCHPAPNIIQISNIITVSREIISLVYRAHLDNFNNTMLGLTSENQKAVLVLLKRVVRTQMIDVNRTRNTTFWSGVGRATITPWMLMAILKYIWKSNSGPLLFSSHWH